MVVWVAVEVQMMLGQAEGSACEGAGGLIRFLGQYCSWEEVNRRGSGGGRNVHFLSIAVA
jgi:hypothetical protein